MKIRISCLILAALLLASAAGCGNTESDPADTKADDTSADESISAEETASDYEWADLDCGGEDFVILNTTDDYGFYYYLDFESVTGEKLDDAVYNRNRELEDRYNFKLKIVEEKFDMSSTVFKQSIAAQDDDFDASFQWANYLAATMLEGGFADLSSIKSMNLDSSWWDTGIDDAMKIGDSNKLYFAFCNTSFVKFEGAQAVFCNQAIFERLGLDMPYQLVLDGKWTLDEMIKLATVGANLNGDDSFSWNSRGNAQYGVIGNQGTVYGLIYSTGNKFIDKDEDGMPYFAAGSEHFYDSLTKISELTFTDGAFLHLNSTGEDHYEAAFKNGRGLMMTAELKAASKYRDMDDGFGIVPLPKYDEKQENYVAIGDFAHAAVIPSTSRDPERAGAILDALAYLTDRDVMPVFYENTMSQKRLRDDDSVKMLGIISDSFYLDPGKIYSWTSELREKFIRMLGQEKKNDFASTVDEARSSIERSIAKTVSQLIGDTAEN